MDWSSRRAHEITDFIQVGFAPSKSLQFPRGSQLLLIGPPGEIKTLFTLRYLADRLEKEESCVYATTLLAPNQVRETLSRIGGEEIATKLRIADGVSALTAKSSPEPFVFRNLYDLNTINLVLLQITADMENGHLCIDNLTTLMTYSSPIAVIKFLQVLCARLKDRQISSLFLLERDVQDKEIVATLKFILDGVIEIQDLEVKGELTHLIRLAFVRGALVNTRWLAYSNTEPLQFVKKSKG